VTEGLVGDTGLNVFFKKNEAKRIDSENLKLAQRIICQNSTLNSFRKKESKS